MSTGPALRLMVRQPCRSGRHRWSCEDCRVRCCNGYRIRVLLPGDPDTEHDEREMPGGSGYGWAAERRREREPGEDG